MQHPPSILLFFFLSLRISTRETEWENHTGTSDMADIHQGELLGEGRVAVCFGTLQDGRAERTDRRVTLRGKPSEVYYMQGGAL